MDVQDNLCKKNTDDKISTVYNPNLKKHSWYYTGPSPSSEDYKMMKEYLNQRFKRNKKFNVIKLEF